MTGGVLLVLAAYGLVLLCGCAMQRRLLFFPSRSSLAEGKVFAAQNGFEPWTNSSGGVIGWKFPAPVESTGSVLVVHGNGGAALNRRYLAEPICRAAGLDVYVLEYPGYGARDGSPSLKSWLAAGEEALALLSREEPVYVVSESLGAGVAAHLAKTCPEVVSGMAMIVPYDSLPSLAQNRMPWLLPYLFLRDRFEPAAWMKDYRGPVQFIIAGSDEVIPPKFGRRLYDSYSGPKRLEVVPGAGHNEVAGQPVDWWRGVVAFWQTNSVAETR